MSEKHWAKGPFTFIFIFIFLLALCAFPLKAYAADANIESDDDHYVLAEHGHVSGDTIKIAEGLSVTIIGDTGTTYSDFTIMCSEGVHLTIQDLAIDDSADAKCPIEFSGAGNTLTLSGASNLIGGVNEPAIRADGTTALSIGGSGSVSAKGGQYAAGVGGGYDASGGDITISGGTIDATGGEYAAGLGGGNLGGGGAIALSGGTIMTAAGTGAPYDIGNGASGAAGTWSVSGTAAVFLRNSSSVEPVTESHTHEEIMHATGTSVYGVPCSWTGGFGAYLRLFTLDYSANGGSGTPPGSVTQHSGTTCTVADDTGLSRTGYFFAGWNTESDGSGTDVAAGSTFAFNATTTLYAQWAPTHITANGTYLLYDGYSGRTVTIDQNLTVTLKGNGNTLTNIRFNCGAGIHLTVENVKLDDSSNDERCPIAFAGAGNTMTLSGENTFQGGGWVPGILEDNATVLEINGSGTVNATGGIYAAGIGGSGYGSGGNLTISGGTVNATGGGVAAGIGGGYNGAGGNITVSGGTVDATGGNNGAGIGGGSEGTGGTIEISGGTVNATGGGFAAGIGGGDFGSGGNITISGGTVDAAGGDEGAGIGGGCFGSGGTITITGGKVMATRGSYATYDIGSGAYGSGGTLSISDTADVFLRTNTCITPSTTHTHLEVTQIDGGKAYGIDMPSGWTTPFGIYIQARTLTYDANGGSGTVPAVTQHTGTTCTVSNGSGLSRAGYVFAGWNTESDGSGTDVAAGSTFAFDEDATLYAQWAPTSITANGTYVLYAGYSGSTVTIDPGLTVTLQGDGSTLTNIRIDCGAGIQLTIENVKIDDSANNTRCPIAFAGAGNTLTLSGENTFKGGGFVPGILEDNETVLEINGSGTVNATGGIRAAGIGGSQNGAGGNLTISGGTVNATGGGWSAGIGGGEGKSGGTIMISGGEVDATGGFCAAGIGGGESGGGGAITISGGSVDATGGSNGAGIGGGVGGGGGEIALSGGKVMATKGSSAPYDIGDGSDGTGGTLNISGTAAVFLRNDTCVVPTTLTHAHESITGADGVSVYGVPLSWTGDFGAYLRLVTLSYNVNGGSGTVPAVKQHIGTDGAVSNGSGLSRSGYKLIGWNTAANGSGTYYASGDTFTFNANATLYAQWLGTPTLTATSGGYNSVKLTWSAVSGRTKYQLYRATSSTGTYSHVTTTTATSYTNTSRTTGKTYYYKVRAYRTLGSKTAYGNYSGVKSAKPIPATPTLTAKSAGYTSVKLTWSSVSGRSGYRLYRATSKTGTYSLVKITSATSYTNTGRTTGKTYYYKVKAYRKVGSTNVYGNYSSVKSAKPIPSKPSSVKAVRASSKSIKVTWGSVSGATKYQVYRATSRTGTYSLRATTTSRSYTNTGLTTGKYYYYKVRAYHMEGSTKVYGSYSSVVYAKP